LHHVSGLLHKKLAYKFVLEEVIYEMEELKNSSNNAEEMPSKSVSEEEQTQQKKEKNSLTKFDDSDFQNLDKEKMFELYEKSLKNLAEGEVVEGIVVKVTDTEVMVDVGYKSEGVIDIGEFYNAEGKLDIKLGDKVEVLFEQIEDQDGYIILSREKAEKMHIWEEIEKNYREGNVITGRVIERIKGGLAIDIGIRAFLPGSQIDVRPVKNLDEMRGQELKLKVIKMNKRRGNIVLSRKIVIEDEIAKKRKQTLENLEEGKIISGVVKNITEYGAFIDLGGLDGLLHITDMSWGRVNHPSELFMIGDKVDVVVLQYDREKERVSLGYKQKTSDPWLTVDQKYPVGSRVRGKIVSLTDYGAFVELEEGVEGLIHISEMSWNKRIKHPSKLVAVGDTVEAIVLSVHKDARRISLGLKQTEPNPWKLLEEKYNEGDIIEGKVRNLTSFGAFVEVDEGIDGLIHISDMSWNKKIKHPSEVIKKGEIVKAVVLSIDRESQKLSLGLKQMTPNIWEQYFNDHTVGDVVKGKIVRLTNFGAFVELAEGIEGLVHVSELNDKRVEDPQKEYSVGQELEMKILKMDFPQRKISLSVIAAQKEKEAEETKKRVEAARGPKGINLSSMVNKDGLKEIEKFKAKADKKQKELEKQKSAEEQEENKEEENSIED
jgi:small subunit ribosomal protein S1